MRDDLEVVAGGERIGRLAGVLRDQASGEVEWLVLRGGGLGHATRVVPAVDASWSEDSVQVPYGRAAIEEAPDVASTDGLTRDEEASLYAHFGVPWSEVASPSGMARRFPGRPDDDGDEGPRRAARAERGPGLGSTRTDDPPA